MIDRRAYYVTPGSLKNLHLVSEKLHEPVAGEVMIKIKSIGLNFADVFCVLGLYAAAPKSKFIPGLEFSGEILKAGPGVEKFKEGDRIMGVSRFGAFADHIVVSENYVVPLPYHWTFAEGSAYLVQVLTAYYGLVELGAVKNNASVLIHSAAGGVGIWANRIAKKHNCYTIGVVGKESKFKVLEEEKYDACFIRNKKSFKSDLINALNGRPLNIIMDSIGGKIMEKGYDLLAPMGRLIVFGSAHYTQSGDKPNYLKLLWKYIRRPKLDVQNMIGENKSVMAFNLIYLFDHAELMQSILDEIEKMQLGRPVIGQEFPFEDLQSALRKFQQGNTTGKVVISV